MLTPVPLCVVPARIGPDPGQHVPDCSDQPRPGQPAGSGGDGARRHTHRQHCHTGRPGSGGRDLGAVTLWTSNGVEGTEQPSWRLVYLLVFFQDNTLCTMLNIFLNVPLQGKVKMIINALCLLCKDKTFVVEFHLSSYFLSSVMLSV